MPDDYAKQQAFPNRIGQSPPQGYAIPAGQSPAGSPPTPGTALHQLDIAMTDLLQAVLRIEGLAGRLIGPFQMPPAAPNEVKPPVGYFAQVEYLGRILADATSRLHAAASQVEERL